MEKLHIKKVLIANRGEIAVRVIRACRAQGVATVAVFSDADAEALHVAIADEAVNIGPPAAQESYLRVDKLLAAAEATGANAIHPGYGFLSENAGFAKAVADAGLIWIGPSAEVIEVMGSKTRARALMKKAGVPVVPGFDEAGATVAQLKAAADSMGYPVLVKASAGGGGKGMRLVEASEDFLEAAEGCQREAKKAFSDDRIFVEKFVTRPRHIEFQIIADSQGNTVHVFERECSIQRRHQKVVEESPSIALSPELREKMGAAAVAAAEAVSYTNAGTVEFILDESGAFYFLEMNTRLQVEHPVTEEVAGVDLVAVQLAVAQGEALPFTQGDLSQRGNAIEVRIYAEDPAQGFMPATGDIIALQEPKGPGVRVDSALYAGGEVSIHYDPMLAKLICWGPDRMSAIRRMAQALDEFVVLGVTTNVPFLKDVITHPAFAAGDTTTRFIEDHIGEWSPKGGGISAEEIALMAAADYLSARGSQGSLGSLGSRTSGSQSSNNDGRGDGASPWNTLGSWRMGGRS